MTAGQHDNGTTDHMPSREQGAGRKGLRDYRLQDNETSDK